MISKAMQVTKLGDPLTMRDIELTSPAEDMVLVKVLATSVNFADTLIVQGKYQEKPPLPFAPGMEVVGEVLETGSAVRTFAAGDRIISYTGFGGMSAAMTIPAANCTKLPTGADPVTSAALPIAYSTSHLALFHRAGLKAGETLVVLGASGGVGLTAVELGVLAGANVVACARGPEKLNVARQKGAHHLLDTTDVDLKQAVRDLGGADVVYDPVGGDLFYSVLRACNPEARVLPLGFASGDIPQIPANIILVKNISVLGFYWGGYRIFAPEILNDNIAHVVRLAQEGQISPHISHVLPLQDANKALALLSERKATGKVIIDLSL